MPLPSLPPSDSQDPFASLATSWLADRKTASLEVKAFQWVSHGDTRSVVAAVKANPNLLGSPGGPPLVGFYESRNGPRRWEASLLDLALDRHSMSMAWALIREGAWPVGDSPPAPGVSGPEAQLSISIVEACHSIDDLHAGLEAVAASGRNSLPWPRMLSAAIGHGSYILAVDICEAHGVRLSSSDIKSLLGDDHGWTAGLFWCAQDFYSSAQKKQQTDGAGSHCQAVQQKLLTFFEGLLPSETSSFIWTEAIVADRPDVLHWMSGRGWTPTQWRASAPESRRNWAGSSASKTLSKKEAKREPSLVEAAILERRSDIVDALLSIPEAVSEFLSNPPSVNALSRFPLSMLKLSRDVGVNIFKVDSNRQNFLHAWALANPSSPCNGWQSIAAMNSDALCARDSNGKTPVEIQLSSMHHTCKAFEDFSKMAARIDQRAMARELGEAPKRKPSSARRL